MSDYRVLRPFAWEGQLYNPGQILRQSNPVEASIIREWPWPSFFTAETTCTETRAPVRRRPKAGLARRVDVSPLARVCRHGEVVLRGASCPRCQVEKLERARRRGSTTARGYGSAHRALRKRLAPLVASGHMRCARCGELILPGTPFDLGHADGDRTRYHGLEHAVCNRGASRMGRRISD